MFDPETVAFELGDIITIWHKDPCADGTDNSCDWFGSKRKLSPKERAIADAWWNLQHTLGNAPYYPNSRAYAEGKLLGDAVVKWRMRPRWRWHPRWHVHHWRIQIRPLQNIKRWLFTRCATCGGRFAYGETGIGTWGGYGPRWFKSETLTHFTCHDKSEKPHA